MEEDLGMRRESNTIWFDMSLHDEDSGVTSDNHHHHQTRSLDSGTFEAHDKLSREEELACESEIGSVEGFEAHDKPSREEELACESEIGSVKEDESKVEPVSNSGNANAVPHPNMEAIFAELVLLRDLVKFSEDDFNVERDNWKFEILGVKAAVDQLQKETSRKLSRMATAFMHHVDHVVAEQMNESRVVDEEMVARVTANHDRLEEQIENLMDAAEIATQRHWDLNVVLQDIDVKFTNKLQVLEDSFATFQDARCEVAAFQDERREVAAFQDEHSEHEIMHRLMSVLHESESPGDLNDQSHQGNVLFRPMQHKSNRSGGQTASEMALPMDSDDDSVKSKPGDVEQSYAPVKSRNEDELLASHISELVKEALIETCSNPVLRGQDIELS